MNLGFPGTGAGDRVSRLVRQGEQRFSTGTNKSLFCGIILINVFILSLYQDHLLYGQKGRICLELNVYYN